MIVHIFNDVLCQDLRPQVTRSSMLLLDIVGMPGLSISPDPAYEDPRTKHHLTISKMQFVIAAQTQLNIILVVASECDTPRPYTNVLDNKHVGALIGTS